MSSVTKDRFQDTIETLPPLPMIAQRILSATESAETSADDVALVVSEEPAIAAKVLRVVNSSFYGAGRKITQISRAVVIMGSKAVRNLVLGICARDTLSKKNQQTAEHSTLWQHSIVVASASELIAKRIGFRPAEEAFIAGLLHDIGQLAMATLKPDLFRRLLWATGPEVAVEEREQSLFGLSHAEAGYHVLKHWQLPDCLCRVVRHHHDLALESDDSAFKLAAVVALADVLAYRLGIGFDLPCHAQKRFELTVNSLQLDENDLVTLLEAVERRAVEAVEMLADSGITIRKARPATRRAILIAAEKQRTCDDVLFERQGYAVRRMTSEEMEHVANAGELAIVYTANCDAGEFDELVRLLVMKGFARLVVVDASPSEPLHRHRDADTGFLHVPRIFTAFDLDWLDEQVWR